MWPGANRVAMAQWSGGRLNFFPSNKSSSGASLLLVRLLLSDKNELAADLSPASYCCARSAACTAGARPGTFSSIVTVS